MSSNLFSDNPILTSIGDWFKRNFSDPNAISLFFTIVFGILFLEFFGKLLLPVLISIVVSYLLASVVRGLKYWRFPHMLAVSVVYTLFIGLLVYFVVGLLPSLWKQLINLTDEIPSAFSKSQVWFQIILDRYPHLFSDAQMQYIMSLMKDQSMKVGQLVLQYSLASIPGVIQLILYFILVPLLVFFFLKDSNAITDWFEQYMPSNRSLVTNVWNEVNDKIGAYVKGRVAEILIIGIITSITFSLLGLQYSVLLGSLVGLSVIIPYIGAVLVTLPVVIIALMQFGLSAHFLYVMIAYGVIITLDANVLVPLLFSEAMNLHPIVIILSVVVFGGIWGFWGVFFAIPLATLVSAILKAWPRANEKAAS